MISGTALRTAVTGLIMWAAAEEEMLLASAPRQEQGGPDRWAAIPVIAHHSEFRQQQVIRLDAVRAGTTPPGFPEIDHQSTQVYQSYAAQTAAEVTRQSRQSVTQLIDGLNAVSDDDLSDSSRHPWLRGRQLWLQVVVRGFWHPTGHIGEYYISRQRPAGAFGRWVPWHGRPRARDVCCGIAIVVSAVYAVAAIPLTPALIATHPVLLELLTGSNSSIVAAGAFSDVGGKLQLAVVVAAALPGMMRFDWVYWWAGRLWGQDRKSVV